MTDERTRSRDGAAQRGEGREAMTAKPVFTPAQVGRLQTVFAEFGRAMSQQSDAIVKWGVAVHRAAWQAYRAAGMPYGETEDGLLRFARERRHAQELRDEADQIEAMHVMCARLRAATREAKP